MARGTTPIDKIDWALLREQKQWLIDQEGDYWLERHRLRRA